MRTFKKQLLIVFCGLMSIVAIIYGGKKAIEHVKEEENSITYSDTSESKENDSKIIIHDTTFEHYKANDEISYDKDKVITYQNISSRNWVLAKVLYEDGITDVILAFEVTEEEYPNGDITYYYLNELQNDYNAISVTYIKDDKTIYNNTATKVKEFIYLDDKLDELGIKKDEYTGEEIVQIYSDVLENVQNGKRLGKKSYFIEGNKIHN